MPLSYTGIASGSQAASAQLKQVLDLLTGVMTDQVATIAHATASPLKLNRTGAAASQGLLEGQRAGTTKWWLGLDTSDQFALLNAAGSAVNLGITDAGAGSFRAGLTLGGSLTLSPATAKILLGSSGGGFRDSADTIDLLALSAAGLATYRNQILAPTAIGGATPTTSWGTLPLKYDEQSLSGASSVVIPSSGSLPTTFRHVEIVYRLFSSTGGIQECGTRINADAASHYQAQRHQANGTVITASEQTGAVGYAGLWYIGPVAGSQSSGRIFIPDYNLAAIKTWEHQWTLYSSATFPPVAGALYTGYSSGAWGNIGNGITSITLLPLAGTFTGVVTTYLWP